MPTCSNGKCLFTSPCSTLYRGGDCNPVFQNDATPSYGLYQWGGEVRRNSLRHIASFFRPSAWLFGGVSLAVVGSPASLRHRTSITRHGSHQRLSVPFVYVVRMWHSGYCLH